MAEPERPQITIYV